VTLGTALFASDVPCRLVLAKRHELRVTQMTIASPFEERIGSQPEHRLDESRRDL
jgi:hypothetical protein